MANPDTWYRDIEAHPSYDVFGDEDLLGGELGEDFGDVHAVGEACFVGNELGGADGILRFGLEVQLPSYVIRDEICGKHKQ